MSTRISKQKEAKEKLALFLSLSAFPGQLSPITDPEEKRRGATQVSFAARFTVKGFAPLAQEAILSYIAWLHPHAKPRQVSVNMDGVK